ncbi:NmrA family NAD(P)-binding protein, partial [Streptomyces sp. NPDC048255]
MTAPILVTGGTGTLGKHVVPLLRAAGHDVRVLCRTPRENTTGIEYFA